MKKYYYPQNLKAKTTIFYWSARDILVLIAIMVAGAISLVAFKSSFLLAAGVVYGLLSFRITDTTVLDFIENALYFLILSPQYFEYASKTDIDLIGETENNEN